MILERVPLGHTIGEKYRIGSMVTIIIIRREVIIVMVKHESTDIKIIRKDGDKFFCRVDVDPKEDLLAQGCRKSSDLPDIVL